MPDSPKFYTVQAAAETLGVSRYRIWSMIKNGEIDARPNPIDRREKLIPAADVERLLELLGSIKKAAA